MIVVFRQADLDTCVAAAILGAGASGTTVRHRRYGATLTELADPSVVTIEAGGGGTVALNNFDHHRSGGPVEPACWQAFESRGRPDAFLRLADFAAAVDIGRLSGRALPRPSVTNLISGIRLLSSNDPVRQFQQGVAVADAIAKLGVDPWQPLPTGIVTWQAALERHDLERRMLNEAAWHAEIIEIAGCRVGFLATNAAGACGLLYRLGAEIAVVEKPCPESAERRKFTIAATGRRVDCLLTSLDRIECGWGGPAHGTIIGSPWRGSRLTMADVREMLEEELGCGTTLG